MNELFNTEELKAIARANVIESTVKSLWVEQDTLLDPIAEKAMKAGPDVVRELIKLLPSSFHRLELETWLNLKAPLASKPTT
jgi:hypothetical protein